MSLYGPRIKLPRLELPEISAPSFDLGEMKKVAIMVGVVLFVIVILFLVGAPTINWIGGFLLASTQESIKLKWNNNPWNIKQYPYSTAELSITFINNTTTDKNVYFSLNYPKREFVEFCPDYHLEALSPGDQRKITCLFRRVGEIYSGTYTIEIVSNLGSQKTKLEIIAK